MSLLSLQQLLQGDAVPLFLPLGRHQQSLSESSLTRRRFGCTSLLLQWLHSQHVDEHVSESGQAWEDRGYFYLIETDAGITFVEVRNKCGHGLPGGH